MEARIQHGISLKRIFECLKELIIDVNFDCDENGMTLQAIDSSHIALVVLKLRENFFDRYRCSRCRSLGLNLTSVCKVFKLCNQDDAVVIRHDDNNDSVSFIFESAGDDKVSTFDLKLMQIDSENFAMPDVKFDAVANLPSKHYQRICSDFSQFSDSITISITKSDIKFSCQGDIGGGNTVLKPKDAEAEKVEIIVTNEVCLTFAARYMNFFGKCSIIANQVRIAMSHYSPLEVTFNVQDSFELGDLKFYLAPKCVDAETD